MLSLEETQIANENYCFARFNNALIGHESFVLTRFGELQIISVSAIEVHLWC